MATCKHCGRDDLKWKNIGTEEHKQYRLEEPGGELHSCMREGKATRLGGIFRMLQAMSPHELADTIAYAAKELTNRVERALNEGDPVLKTKPQAMRPGPKGPEPMDEQMPF